jgi:regulator of sigma E protease
MIVAFLSILLVLVVVIGLHEAGHALAARMTGVKIQRISIGFGRPILLWKGKSGCEWVWAIWPLGGYVQLLNTRISPVKKADYSVCFDKKPVWVRVFILLSGSLVNFLVAFLALTFFFMIGFERDIPVIQNVAVNSIASAAGIKDGSRIIELAGRQTSSWRMVGTQLIISMGKNNVAAKILEPDQTVRVVSLDLSSKPSPQNKSLFSYVGVTPALMATNHETVPGESFIKASRQAFGKTIHLLEFYLLMLKQIITGVIPFSMLLGPFGLLALSMDSFIKGLSMFLDFIASLSLTVGLVNLLPIPTLDGGSIMYALVEKIRGKPVSIAFEILLHRLTMILFALVLMQLIMNDLLRYMH